MENRVTASINDGVGTRSLETRLASWFVLANTATTTLAANIGSKDLPPFAFTRTSIPWCGAPRRALGEGRGRVSTGRAVGGAGAGGRTPAAQNRANRPRSPKPGSDLDPPTPKPAGASRMPTSAPRCR
jgi:hypothetical protein